MEAPYFKNMVWQNTTITTERGEKDTKLEKWEGCAFDCHGDTTSISVEKVHAPAMRREIRDCNAFPKHGPAHDQGICTSRISTSMGAYLVEAGVMGARKLNECGRAEMKCRARSPFFSLHTTCLLSLACTSGRALKKLIAQYSKQSSGLLIDDLK